MPKGRAKAAAKATAAATGLLALGFKAATADVPDVPVPSGPVAPLRPAEGNTLEPPRALPPSELQMVGIDGASGLENPAAESPATPKPSHVADPAGASPARAPAAAVGSDPSGRSGERDEAAGAPCSHYLLPTFQGVGDVSRKREANQKSDKFR